MNNVKSFCIGNFCYGFLGATFVNFIKTYPCYGVFCGVVLYPKKFAYQKNFKVTVVKYFLQGLVV